MADKNCLLQQLCATFENQIDRDVIEMVFANCSYRVEETVLTLSSLLGNSREDSELARIRESARANDVTENMPTSANMALKKSNTNFDVNLHLTSRQRESDFSTMRNKAQSQVTKLNGSFSPRRKQDPGSDARKPIKASVDGNWKISPKMTPYELISMFPSVEKEVLREIYLAMKVEEGAVLLMWTASVTCRNIALPDHVASLFTASSCRTPLCLSIIERRTKITLEHSELELRRLEDFRQNPPLRNKTRHERRRRRSDGVDCDADSTIEAVTSSLKILSKSPAKDCRPVSELQPKIVSIEQHSHEKQNKVVDRSAINIAESAHVYSALWKKFSTYLLHKEFRTKAQVHATLNKNKLRTAKNPNFEQNEPLETYYPEQARNPTHPIKEAHERTPGIIFENGNPINRCSSSVDLHGFHCDQAIETLASTLEQVKLRNLKFIDVITGRGAHSKGNIPKLRPSVLSYLNRNEYRFASLNEGCIRVYLR